MHGSIRVGTIKHTGQTKTFGNYRTIEVMTASSPYFSLSPYALKTKDGVILENAWQFAKLYPKIPQSIQKYSKYNNRIIWSHGEEIHVDQDGNPNELFYQWQKKGFECKDAIRYPVGFYARHTCLCSLYQGPNGWERLGYVEARKKIYVPNYIEAVKREKQFLELLTRLKKGENLLICEVDGPKQESLSYYQTHYHAPSDFIEEGTMLATPENLNIMLEDTKHAFGHGYCLAMALLQELQ